MSDTVNKIKINGKTYSLIASTAGLEEELDVIRGNVQSNTDAIETINDDIDEIEEDISSINSNLSDKLPTEIEGFSVVDGSPYITYKVGADSVSKKLGSTDLSIKVLSYFDSEQFNLSSLPVEDISCIASGAFQWGNGPKTVNCGFEIKYFYAEFLQSIGPRLYATNYYNNELHTDTFECGVVDDISYGTRQLIINEDNFVLNATFSTQVGSGYVIACC